VFKGGDVIALSEDADVRPGETDCALLKAACGDNDVPLLELDSKGPLAIGSLPSS
jgi:hypothetical protein